MKIVRLLLALLVISFFSGCGSDDVLIVETQGIIRDTGEVAADGCGWVVEIDGVQYSPTYLNSQYREDGLAVFLNVEFLNTTFVCGLAPTNLDQIRIEQIRPSGN